jgi:hypothetical protein
MPGRPDQCSMMCDDLGAELACDLGYNGDRLG